MKCGCLLIAVKRHPVYFPLLQERSFTMIHEATDNDNLIRTIDQARDLFESRYDELTERAKHYFQRSQARSAGRMLRPTPWPIRGSNSRIG